MPKYSANDFDIPKIVDYDQFVIEDYEYTNKKGEKKSGKRTVRNHFSEQFVDFKANFDKCRVSYMHHRFEIKNDVYRWPLILNDSKLGYVFHMDYSENISCTPKFEPQDAHFSGKQTSLHCNVIRKPYLPKDQQYYAYHFSDRKIHGSVYTMSVMKDLLRICPDYSDYQILRFKSDNCATQYCCLHTFKAVLKMAMDLKIPIMLYYGVNGHGRGLVDAMSGFGVKGPLRKMVITSDFYFKTATELEDRLKEEFRDCPNRIYTTLDEDELNKMLKARGPGLPIPGCRKARMIYFGIDGSYRIKNTLCSCESCSIGDFDQCKEGDDLNIELEPAFEQEMVELDEMDSAPQVGDRYNFTKEGGYVGLYSCTHF